MIASNTRYLLLMPLLAILSLHSHAATFTVENTNDFGDGSLRRAINNANLTSAPDNIVFDIPGLGPHSIEPLSALPFITEPVRISGYTQPSANPANNVFVANLRIKLDGSSAGQANGLAIFADNVRISGLVIKNFERNGILLEGSNNVVRGNYIGVALQGLSTRPNGMNGISVVGDTNLIGGHRPQHRNIISGNVVNGILLSGDHNMIQGNTIGTDISTTVDFGNGDSGVLIKGNNNLVGGLKAGAGNVISGNSEGIFIDEGQFNQIQGNIIGTDKTASVSQFIGNGTGIKINGLGDSDQNEIGGEVPEARNIISNNIGSGVSLLGDENKVQGNFIGTDGTGSLPLENGSGVSIRGNYNLVGGLNQGSGNIISGNSGNGIMVQGFPTLSPMKPFAHKPTGNIIQANYIGTDVTGLTDLGNGAHGIYVKDADATAIGGQSRIQGNLISGNGEIFTGHGIMLEKVYDEFGGTLNTFVFNNTIGTDVHRDSIIENNGSGIYIEGASLTRIGGVHRGRENYIAGNNGDGITIESGVDNGIVRNWFHSNAGLSIDLAADGVTANDPQDADTGANRLQNFMQIDAVQQSGSSVLITANVQSGLNGLYRADFYATATCDSSGHGEGEIFLGARQVSTDAAGLGSFALNSSVPVPSGYFITGTLSVLGGPFPADTSEFAECVEYL